MDNNQLETLYQSSIVITTLHILLNTEGEGKQIRQIHYSLRAFIRCFIPSLQLRNLI